MMSMPRPASAKPPAVNFNQLPAYFQALNKSHDPQAIEIRKRLAGAKADLAAELAAARKAGIEVDIAKLHVDVPAANDAVVSRHVSLQVSLINMPAAKWIDLPSWAQPMRPGYAYTDEQVAAVRKRLADHAAVVSTIRRACEITGSSLNLLNVDLPRLLERLRGEATVLSTECYLEARDGDYQRAVDDDLRLFNLAKQTEIDPTYMADDLGMGTEQVALSTLLNLIMMSGPDKDRLALLSSTLDHAPRIGSLKNRLILEYAREVRENVDEKTNPSAPEDANTIKLGDAQTAYYLPILRKLIAATNLEPSSRHQAFQALKNVDETYSPLPVSYNSSLPILQGFDVHYAAIESGEMIARTAIDVLLQKAGGGAFPASAGADLKDPFTGSPLGYRLDDDGTFVVYSAGQSGAFDGTVTHDVVQDDVESYVQYPVQPVQVNYDISGPMAATQLPDGTVISVHAPPDRPVPAEDCVDVVRKFLDARKRGDLKAAYGLLSLNSTALVPAADYWNRFSDEDSGHIANSPFGSLIFLLTSVDYDHYFDYELGESSGPSTVTLKVTRKGDTPDTNAVSEATLFIAHDPFDGNAPRIDLYASINITGGEVAHKFTAHVRGLASNFRLAVLSTALAEYVQDNDHYPDADKWVDQLFPYVPSRVIFHNPFLRDNLNGYAFNRALSGKPASSSASVVCIQECDCLWKNAVFSQPFAMPMSDNSDYFEGTAYATADGKVTRQSSPPGSK